MKVPAWAPPVAVVVWLVGGLWAFWPRQAEVPQSVISRPEVVTLEVRDASSQVYRFCDGGHMVYVFDSGDSGSVVWNDDRCRR